MTIRLLLRIQSILLIVTVAPHVSPGRADFRPSRWVEVLRRTFYGLNGRFSTMRMRSQFGEPHIGRIDHCWLDRKPIVSATPTTHFTKVFD